MLADDSEGQRDVVRLPEVAGTWWHKLAVQDKGRASDMYLGRLSGRRGDGQSIGMLVLMYRC
jgi:hypothetical protein